MLISTVDITTVVTTIIVCSVAGLMLWAMVHEVTAAIKSKTWDKANKHWETRIIDSGHGYIDNDGNLQFGTKPPEK